ncbi:ethanolamine-phosphate cytidylyltransferase [Vairimorpha necatrix]|uniref:ethanolamine-phosphate cytidylyltransferase n=1 Tax=Vairimorpha necatrix TaxID=6039 RepID=A0AAX4J8Q5_9MICR
MAKRVWMDGCFDLFHYGHANALRQANELGNEVVCGINDFNDILKNKGLPVFTDEERKEIVSSCRWVHEVVIKVPYTPSVELIKKYNCDYAVHGDDPALDKNGVDVYANPKAIGIFKEVGRTDKISTTEIVGRLMLQERKGTIIKKDYKKNQEFYDNLKEKFKLPVKQKVGKVVFIDGIFDLYHAGHCKALENAKKNGDYLIVGLLNDEQVERYTGKLPIMNENERFLVLCSNKNIDEVIFSPYNFDEDFLKKHQISKILSSYDLEDKTRFENLKENVIQDYNVNPFSDLSTGNIIKRIILNYQEYEKRQSNKQ